MKESIGHPQRLEDALAQELVERLIGNDLDDAPQGVERRAGAVAPLRARLEVQGPKAATK
jgi:hypothetical protein